MAYLKDLASASGDEQYTKSLIASWTGTKEYAREASKRSKLGALGTAALSTAGPGGSAIANSIEPLRSAVSAQSKKHSQRIRGYTVEVE